MTIEKLTKQQIQDRIDELLERASKETNLSKEEILFKYKCDEYKGSIFASKLGGLYFLMGEF